MDVALKNVLERITPSENERRKMRDILKRVTEAADKIIKPLGLEKTIAGSFIRDTWLKDKKEIDLFILFPVSTPREDLEKIGIDVGKKIVKMLGGKYEIAYAEHPYVKGKLGRFSIDIVPCYKVKSASKIISAVDRTPFHNRYIEKNLKPVMSKEVRLLKQFCKAMDVYGSDVKTLGFSGYLCELLIIKYKTFRNLVLKAGGWKPGEFIDLGRHCTIKNPKSFFKAQPLIVIDPTDPKRNVAAALSERNFVKFVKSCEAFVKNPSKKFFEKDKRSISIPKFRTYLKERGTKIFAVRFRRPKVVDDILWSQMRKTCSRIANLLKEYEFEVFENAVWSDEKDSYLIFEMSEWFLPKKRKLEGPPVYSKKHSKQFTEKYRKAKVYVEGKIWVAEVEREYRDAEKLLERFLKRSEKSLLMDGVRSHIAKSIAKEFKILDSKGFEKVLSRNKELAIIMRKYFEGE